MSLTNSSNVMPQTIDSTFCAYFDISSNRPLSLLCSLINKPLIFINAFYCPRTEHPVFHQVYLTVEQVLKLDFHTCNFQQSDRMTSVILNKDIYIAPGSLLITRI